jgi:hypothetical protein
VTDDVDRTRHPDLSVGVMSMGVPVAKKKKKDKKKKGKKGKKK